MEIEQIKKDGKCCITGKPMHSSKYVNGIQLPYKASWKYPVWGNIVTGHSGMAVAYVHDEAFDSDGNLVGTVQWAVEFSGNEIIYHDVNTLVHDDL